MDKEARDRVIYLGNSARSPQDLLAYCTESIPNHNLRSGWMNAKATTIHSNNNVGLSQSKRFDMMPSLFTIASQWSFATNTSLEWILIWIEADYGELHEREHDRCSKKDRSRIQLQIRLWKEKRMRFGTLSTFTVSIRSSLNRTLLRYYDSSNTERTFDRAVWRILLCNSMTTSTSIITHCQLTWQ